MARDCVFCKIYRGDISSDILYQDEHCFVIRDIAPKAPVHLLIIPTQHFTYLAGLTDEFVPVLGSMFKAAGVMAGREDVGESGYRLIINQGRNSGQEVPHLHLHLLGGKRMSAMG